MTMTGHTEGVSDIAWSPDSELLASASDDKTIRIWHVDSVCQVDSTKRREGHSRIQAIRERPRKS